MAVTLTNTGITYSDGTSTTTAPSQVKEKFSSVSTSTNRSVGYSTSWVDHLSFSFTTTRTDMITFTAHFSTSYESGPVQPFVYIYLSDGTSSPSDFKFAMQFDINRAIACHGFHWTVQRPAGTRTAYLRVRNIGSGSTWIANYWGGQDRFNARYF